MTALVEAIAWKPPLYLSVLRCIVVVFIVVVVIVVEYVVGVRQ